MATAQDILNIVFALADEIDDTGYVSETDTASYRVRTPGILTALIAEWADLKNIPTTPEPIKNLTDIVQTDELTARTFLAYGLGMELFKEENETVYYHFRNRYKEAKDFVIRKQLAVEQQITNLYGPI